MNKISKKFNKNKFIAFYSKVPSSPEKTASVQSPLKTSASNHEMKTTLEFSSADSLESSVSLVSAGITTAMTSTRSSTLASATSTRSSSSPSEVTEVIVNAEKGTREKRFKDGKIETWYSNGNRYGIG